MNDVEDLLKLELVIGTLEELVEEEISVKLAEEVEEELNLEGVADLAGIFKLSFFLSA